MICFMDISFCADYSHGCHNHECERALTEEKMERAKKWWKGDNPPVAFMSFIADCPVKITEPR